MDDEEGLEANIASFDVAGAARDKVDGHETTDKVDDITLYANDAIQEDIDAIDVTTDEGKVDDECIENVVTDAVDDGDIESDITMNNDDAMKEEKKKRGRPKKNLGVKDDEI